MSDAGDCPDLGGRSPKPPFVQSSKLSPANDGFEDDALETALEPLAAAIDRIRAARAGPRSSC